MLGVLKIMRTFFRDGHMLQRLQRDILDFVGSGFLKFVGSRHLRPNACGRSFILGKLRSFFFNIVWGFYPGLFGYREAQGAQQILKEKFPAQTVLMRLLFLGTA